jgi:AAA domain
MSVNHDAFASPSGGSEALTVSSLNGGGGAVDRNAAQRARGDAGGRSLAQGGAGNLEARPVAVADVPVPLNGRDGVSWSEGGDPRRARLGIGRPTTYDWRVEGVLPDGAYAFLYGKFASFKSLVALDLAERVARQMPLSWGPNGSGEYRVKFGPVLYIAAEDYEGIELRRRAWEAYHGVGATPLLEVASVPLQMLDREQVEYYAEYILSEQVKLVLLDTLHRSMEGGSEVSDTDTATVTAAVARLQQAFYATPEDIPETDRIEHEWYSSTWDRSDAPDWVTPEEAEDGMAVRYKSGPWLPGKPTILLVHHPNQRTNTLRGHGGFYGDSDTIFRMTRKNKNSPAELYCEKQKNGPDGWSVTLEFVPVGKSGVVVPVEEKVEGVPYQAHAAHVRWKKPDPNCPRCNSDATSGTGDDATDAS